MLPVLNSNYWFPTMFDEFFNNEWMPKAKATAPAVNVKEDAKAYTMEIAVPGVKKEYCRVNINADGNLEVAIENKLEHKEEEKSEDTICAASSATPTTSRFTLCRRISSRRRSLLRWSTVC